MLPSAPEAIRPLKMRWVMIAFAFLATVINYLDRQTLSVVAPQLKTEFAMSDETYGLIVSAFMLAYTVMNGVSGPLLDRIGTRVGYALCMVWWSTAGVLHALATGPPTSSPRTRSARSTAWPAWAQGSAGCSSVGSPDG